MQKTYSSNRSRWHSPTCPRTKKLTPKFFCYYYYFLMHPTHWSLEWPCRKLTMLDLGFQGSLFEHFWPVCIFPSHSLWPHAPGREGEALGWGFLRSGAHAPGGGWLKDPGQASLRELSEELPLDQSQGQGHPLRENQWQRCEFAFYIHFIKNCICCQTANMVLSIKSVCMTNSIVTVHFKPKQN